MGSAAPMLCLAGVLSPCHEAPEAPPVVANTESSPALFDHLVGAGEYRRQNFEAQVLTLTASSSLVGAFTGRSAGFSPLRMRPV
jgi:hypothetical protein